MFEKLAAKFIQQIEDPVKNGRFIMIQDSQGKQEVLNQKGMDPRMLGEAARELISFAVQLS